MPFVLIQLLDICLSFSPSIYSHHFLHHVVATKLGALVISSLPNPTTTTLHSYCPIITLYLCRLVVLHVSHDAFHFLFVMSQYKVRISMTFDPNYFNIYQILSLHLFPL